MRSCVRFAVALLFGALPGVVKAAPPLRSVSTSRQFIVYGGDVRLRGVLCDFAETTKAALLRRLNLADNWKAPILVNADPGRADQPEQPPMRLSVSQTEAGLKLQLNVTLGAELRSADVQQQLLRALLIELMYRGRENVSAGTVVVEPPAWLREGSAALDLRSEGTDSYDTLSPLIAAKKTATLAEFLQQKPELLDESSRALYRSYSAALVQLLTGSAEDCQRLVRFVRDLPDAPNDPSADFAAHFPSLATGDAWRDALATLMAGEQRPLTFADTSRALDQLLTFKLADEKGAEKSYVLAELANVRRAPSISRALAQRSRELLLLELRADPVYRPLVHEYAEIALLTARNRAHRMAKRLARLAASRVALQERITKIDDFLNWFEATQMKTTSGVFNDYLKTARESPEQPRRHDPISVYLDTLEAQLGD